MGFLKGPRNDCPPAPTLSLSLSVYLFMGSVCPTSVPECPGRHEPDGQWRITHKKNLDDLEMS